MALNRAKSRPINIDGENYRWSFFQNSGYDDVTVQHASGKGRKLAVQIVEPVLSVTPALVAQSIQFALASGWRADARGPPFNVRYEDRTFRVR